jgi:hypothetical protein
MLMQEHEDNNFTKEKSDIERYLLRVVQRYFEIENVNSQISVENIIIESIRRIKQDVFDKKGFMFSLNEQTGHITLTIQVFNGEYQFDKNTAFNKEFGNQADTICEGNDKRLSNKRQPLSHIHDIGDIENLWETLQNFIVQIQEVHYHRNANILDILTYSGTQTEIDLIVIDDLLNKINSYYTNLDQQNLSLKAEFNTYKDMLGRALISTKNNLTSMKDYVNQSFVWVSELKRDITNKLQQNAQNSMGLLNPYLLISDVNALVDYMYKIFTMNDNGERHIVSMYTSFEQQEDSTQIIGTHLIYHVVQDKAKLYFRYEKNNNTYTVPLPFMMKIPFGFCYIQGGQESNNEIFVETKIIAKMKDKIDANNIYQDRAIVFASSNDCTFLQAQTIINNEKMRMPILTEVMKLFITSLIKDDRWYYVNAFKEPGENRWFATDVDGNEINLPYTADDFAETSGDHVCIDKDGVLHRVDGVSTIAGYIAEYDIPDFYSYFQSPRIYYETYKEGI